MLIFEYGIVYSTNPAELELVAAAFGHFNLALSADQVMKEFTYAFRGADRSGVDALHPAMVAKFVIRLSAHVMAHPANFQQEAPPPATALDYPITTIAGYFGKSLFLVELFVEKRRKKVNLEEKILFLYFYILLVFIFRSISEKSTSNNF